MSPRVDSEEVLDLLACAWRVNRDNCQSFQRRLEQLADIGRDLRQGRCTADDALNRAGSLGFITPLDGTSA